jgi:hypothetical protein
VNRQAHEPSGYFQLYRLDQDSQVLDQDTRNQTTITEYRKDSGGAIAISPSQILLTDHQIPKDWSYIQLGALAKVQSAIISSGEFLDFVDGVGESRLGWEIRTVDPPLDPEYVAQLAGPDFVEIGSECFIPTSARWFSYLNSELCIAEDVAQTFVQGQLVDIDEDPYGYLAKPFLGDGRFAIKVEAALDLRGSSGFPVLIESHAPGKDLVIGLALGAIPFPSLNCTWVIAMKIPPFTDAPRSEQLPS